MGIGEIAQTGFWAWWLERLFNLIIGSFVIGLLAYCFIWLSQQAEAP